MFFVKENALSEKDIEYLLTEDFNYSKAGIYNLSSDNGKGHLTKHRRVRQSLLDKENNKEIFEQIIRLFNEANSVLFKENYDEFLTRIYLMKYDSTDLGHFNWHIDTIESDELDTIRKLSMSIILNDKFHGGELIFKDKTFKNVKPGTCIIFPSTYEHKVDPVLEGTRFSLVAWTYKDKTA